MPNLYWYGQDGTGSVSLQPTDEATFFTMNKTENRELECSDYYDYWNTFITARTQNLPLPYPFLVTRAGDSPVLTNATDANGVPVRQGSITLQQYLIAYGVKGTIPPGLLDGVEVLHPLHEDGTYNKKKGATMHPRFGVEDDAKPPADGNKIVQNSSSDSGNSTPNNRKTPPYELNFRPGSGKKSKSTPTSGQDNDDDSDVEDKLLPEFDERRSLFKFLVVTDGSMYDHNLDNRWRAEVPKFHQRLLPSHPDLINFARNLYSDKFNTFVTQGFDLKFDYFSDKKYQKEDNLVTLIIGYILKNRSDSPLGVYNLLYTTMTELPILRMDNNGKYRAHYRTEREMQTIVHKIYTKLQHKGRGRALKRFISAIDLVEKNVNRGDETKYKAPYDVHRLVPR